MAERATGITTTGPSGTTTITPQYDPAGNTTNRDTKVGTAAATSQAFGYDAEGRTRTVGAKAGGTGSATYLYDADGGLLIQKSTATNILYLFGGTEQLTLDNAKNTVSGLRYYSHPDGTTIVRSSAGKLTYQPTNPQHTAQLQVDASTLAVTRRAFDPYGAPRGTVPTAWADNHGYLGQPTDPTTGLDLLGARNYDPTLGRFLSVDPVLEAGDPSQMGGYAYAADDPINGADPTGLMNCYSCGPGGAAPTGGGPSSGSTEAATPAVAGGSAGTGTTNAVQAGWGIPWGKVAEVTGEALGYGLAGGLGFAAGYACADTIIGAPLSLECAAAGADAGLGVCALLGGDCGTGAHEDPTGNGEHEGTSRGKTSAHDAPEKGEQGTRGGSGHAAELSDTDAPIPAPEHLLDGTTPSKAHPWTPAEAKPGKPAEAAKPSSPKSATAKKPEADDAPSSGKGAACSFDPATPVLLDDGTTKPIADVTVGDKVQDADPATGKHTTSNKVTATWINHDNDLIDVTIQGADGKPATLHTTANHPFWDATTHTWTPAGDLHPGDTLTTAANTEARVLALRITPGTANRYNLTVDHVHTYY